MPRTKLASGAVYEIVEEDDIVSCLVVNRDDVDPDEGAACARQMHDFLLSTVLANRSRYRGLIFDVHDGPPVFGPKTRAALEDLFRRAEAVQRALAVRVGEPAIQKLQFSNLCAECAPAWSKVFERDEAAAEWVRERSNTAH